MSRVGALRRCIGTGSEPRSRTAAVARSIPRYAALLLGAQARNVIAWARRMRASGMPMRSTAC